jgi:hypothetical protein
VPSIRAAIALAGVVISLVVASPALAVGPPALLNIGKVGTNVVNVSWFASGGVRWELHRDTSTLAPVNDANLVAICMTTSCNDWVNPVETSGTYYYTVVAFDDAGNRSVPSPWTTGMALTATGLPTPRFVSPTDGGTVSGTASLSLAGDGGATALRVFTDGQQLGSTLSGSTATVAWDTRALQNGAHRLTLLAATANGAMRARSITVNVDNPRSASLVAAYGFEGGAGTVASDDTGNGHPGTMFGNPAWAPNGRYGKAVSFDGVDDRISLNGVGTSATKAFTLEAWVQPASPKRDVGVVGAWVDSQGGGPMLWLDHLDGHAWVTTGAGMSTYLDSGFTPAVGQWHHLAATYDGTRVRFFVDGDAVAARDFMGAVPPTQAWQIGSYGSNPSNFLFNGLIDEVRIYRRALTASEVATDVASPVADLGTPPGAPQSVSASGGAGTARVVWTGSSGASSYDVYRSTTSGFAPSPANRIGSTSATAWSDTNLAPGTYFYVVIASNAAGLAGPASAEARATVTADTRAPSVMVSAPNDGATVSGTIAPIAWFNDDVGVTALQLHIDGADVGPKNPGPDWTLPWDTRTVADGSHAITITAWDASGNHTTSDPITVTVNNAPSYPGQGLVAAYNFDEGSGSTAADSSGFGRDGTVNAGWWADGHSGSALWLAGGADRVALPALGTFYKQGFSFEAWVKASTAGQRDGGILGTWTPAAGGPMLWVDHLDGHYRVTSGTAIAGYLDSGFGPVASEWHHLAATYDGTKLTAYFDGDPVATRTATSAQLGSSNTWRIGAYDADGLHSFKGLVDDVRIYDRPLSRSEIEAQMDGAPLDPADTGPPTAPTDLTASGRTIGSISLQWTAATDDIGVKDYFVYSGSTKIATVTGTQATVTGLLCGQSYDLGVLAQDAAGHRSAKTTITTPTADCPPRTGLVAAYSFDDGTGATEPDLSGANHTATLVGATRAAGRHGQAVDLAGTQRVDLAPLGTFYKQAFTLEAWVNSQNENERDQGILGSWDFAGNGGPMLWIGWNSYHYRLTLSRGETNYLNAQAFPFPGSWHHVAASYDGTTARFYVDGTQTAERAFSGNVGDSNVWRIGAYGSDPAGFFHGRIDDVRVYSRALNPGEIANDRDEAVAAEAAN